MRVQNKEWGEEQRDKERRAVQTVGQQILEGSTVPFCQVLPGSTVTVVARRGHQADGTTHPRARTRASDR